jgi:leucyl/phenylalanyl-tRNA---protein transferase
LSGVVLEGPIRSVGASGRLTPELILRAYALGIFPMARHRSDPVVHWVAPPTRGIFPLDHFYVPRRLRRSVRRRLYETRCNAAFESVIDACASPAAGRDDTWINGEIRGSFVALHASGFAHSVECWREGRLVGGLYGVALGGAFFGESMFSQERDASKIALVNLVARLRLGHFSLLDIQFVTPHLSQFGAIDIPAAEYLDRLNDAIQMNATFHPEESPFVDSAVDALLTQSSTQMS